MIRWLSHSVVPVVTILVALVAIWYAAAIPMNSARTYMMAPDDAEIPFSELVADTWSQKKPQLPLPHQIVAEVKKQATFAWIWNCLLYTSPSPRDLSTSRMPSSA